MDYTYKIEQLNKMLEAEQHETEGGYGAHLQHWYGNSKGIQLDAEALQALVEHYKNREV